MAVRRDSGFGALATIAVATSAPGWTAPALATASNAAATRAYIQANYRLVQTAASRISVGNREINAAAAKVRGECLLGAAGSPQDSESTQLSNEVIGLMVTAAFHDDLASIHEFVRAAAPLHWSSHSLTATIQGYVSKLKTLASLPEPPLCADVRSWAASGFHSLTADTLAFSPRFMGAWVALGELPAGLSRYEGPEQRALSARAAVREEALSEFEASEVEVWGGIMNSLELHP